MRESGEVISRNLTEAKELNTRTCKGGIRTDCYRLARILEKDREATRRQLLELYDQACKGDVAAPATRSARPGKRPGTR